MRHRRAGVIARTRKEFRELDRLVVALKPADWRRLVPRPEGRDPWTVKDSLAHILHWKEHTARVIRGEKRPAEFRGLETNAINRLIYERWRKRRPADVLAWHRRVQDDVLRTLEATPAAWFSRKEHGADWPGDFTSHSAWHRVRDIEASRRV
ncbi:MAG: maleylpyruvate isomerase N-terminal domain-containing protein [Candidatus Dormibacter sp.]